MKRFYHVCMTAHSEVLLRSVEDVALFTNYTAAAAFCNGADVLTDSEMSTHMHETVISQDIGKFVISQEMSLTKAFNSRHSRKGPLFDDKPYVLNIDGPRHMQMALNYSLRQGLHHGQSETPFAYPWSSCNYLFASERGVTLDINHHCSRSEVKSCLPKNFKDFPDTWTIDSDGVLERRSFEQLCLVENWYGTARNYMFSMIRKTSDEWLAEQGKDDVEGPVVSLELLEKGYSADDIVSMLSKEGSSKFVARGPSDMELCNLIDRDMLGRFKVSSVYDLSRSQKERLAAELRFDVGVRSESQISRCLVMKYDR